MKAYRPIPTVDVLERICGTDPFTLLSIGPAPISGEIGTRYKISVGSKRQLFDRTYAGTWSERDRQFHSDFQAWYRQDA